MQNILKGGLEYAIWNGGGEGGQKRHASDMLQEDVTSVLTCKIFKKFVTNGGGGGVGEGRRPLFSPSPNSKDIL